MVDFLEQLRVAFKGDHLAQLGSAGVLAALGLLVAGWLLLPKSRRRRLGMPSLFLLLHLTAIAFRSLFHEDSAAREPLTLVSIFLLLMSISRSGFLIIVHSVISRGLIKPLPKIFLDIIQGSVYAVALLITLRAAGVEPGSLLTTSALLTAVIGLSLQDTLGNLFAGLAIQAQRPFEVGDWIQFDEQLENIGMVVEINWRAAKVLTIQQIEVTVPNSQLAKAPIRNYTKPMPEARRAVFCTAPYDVPPRRVQRLILSSLTDVPGVVQDPKPTVIPANFDERGVRYEVRYFINDFLHRDVIDGNVRERIWYALSRARIEIPVPQRLVHLHEATQAEEEEEQQRRLEARARYLRGVDFLGSVSDGALQTLAEMSQTRLYDAEEAVIRQGDEAQELFIVQRGKVAILIDKGPVEGVVEVTRLGPGQFFGEMSLMTGSRRNATVRTTEECELLVVSKEAFDHVFDVEPELIARISEVLAKRQAELGQIQNRPSTAPGPRGAEERTAELLSKIRDFFSL